MLKCQLRLYIIFKILSTAWQDQVACTTCCKNSEFKATHGSCKADFGNKNYWAKGELQCTCSTRYRIKTEWKPVASCNSNCQDQNILLC